MLQASPKGKCDMRTAAMQIRHETPTKIKLLIINHTVNIHIGFKVIITIICYV